jgi:hypothetical protein
MRTGGAARWAAAAVGIGLAVVVLAAGAARTTIVVCAPGSPGTTAEAQGAMDVFAAALAAKARLPAQELAATYTPHEDGGVARLRAPDAAVALVSLPFFLKHEKALGLRAVLAPVVQGGEGTERWSLVARKGRVTSASALEGFTLVSSAGFAPGFVRGPALAGWGRLPASVKIVQSAAVLSALRRAASGEDVAVLVDRAQEAALPTLQFAPELEVVARSPALPGGVVATVGGRLPAARWKQLEAALLALPADPDGAAALSGIRMARFVPVDAPVLAAARKAYAEGAR